MAAVAPSAAALAQFDLEQSLWSSVSARLMFQNTTEQLSHDESTRVKLLSKVSSEYSRVRDMPAPVAAVVAPTPAPAQAASRKSTVTITDVADDEPASKPASSSSKSMESIVASLPSPAANARNAALSINSNSSTALVIHNGPSVAGAGPTAANGVLSLRNKPFVQDAPEWHAPWKISKVIAGHLGWVRCLSIDPSNEWFVTGSADRMIKIWDLASGQLKLSLTGHISAVRGVLVSPRHPYLFSVGEDKLVKCWDLEYNKVIRSYHGHLSGVYCVEMHPTIDVLITGSRDSTARVWDIRTKAQVHTLSGHTNTVASISTQSAEPQIITGSHDATIKLWDLAAGKAVVTLTNHKKSVRATLIHPRDYAFASASTDNMKVWKCPEGQFLRNIDSHNAVINCLAVNQDNVLVSGGDNGSIHFTDWSSGHAFQKVDFIAPQPGSMDSESGVFACSFDKTGSRLITCEADKTIKIWKEDETATPESHPLQWQADKKRKKY